MEITKEEIQKRIKNLKQQEAQLVANLNVCVGAIKALEALLEEPKPEITQEGDTVK